MARPDPKEFLYTRLLFALVILLAIGALIAEPIASSIVYALMSIVMVRAVWMNSRNRQLTLITFAIGAANVAMTLWVGIEVRPSTLAITLSRTVGVLFVGAIGAFLLREIWQETDVKLDTIFGAVAVYLLIGIGWTHIYFLIETLEPGSFATLVAASGEWNDATGSHPRLLFFSFVTLTTLGYGDIIPVYATAKGFAIAEAIAGPVFLAILMARLVGLYVARETRADGRRPHRD